MATGSRARVPPPAPGARPLDGRAVDQPLFGAPSSPVMVGRDAELELLIRATAAGPALALVSGEPGVGKTRLVRELLARPELAGRQILSGGCHELSAMFPYGPLVEALRSARLPPVLAPITGALRILLPEIAERLPQAPPALADSGAERHRVFRAVVELLAALGPAVLLVEDLHWADQATVDFLGFLAVHPPADLAVVCTYRREDLPDGSPLLTLGARLPPQSTAVRIELVPLDNKQISELVRTILGIEETPEPLAEYLREHTAGLPLAVEETLLLLRQRRDLVYRQGALVRQQLDKLAVPRKLRDAITERLGRLGPQARAVVQAAAVFATNADEPVLARLTGMDEVACGDALAEALAPALLVEAGDGRYGFRHALARQTVEAGIPAPLRRRLHLRAARILEQGGDRPLARLAHHYRAAGETAKWVRYAEAAADRAISLNDHAAAYALLRDAVSITEMPPARRGSLAVRLARHAMRCRAYHDAIAILRPLLDDPAIPVTVRGRLRYRLSRLLYDAGDPQAARDEAAWALDEVDERHAAGVLAWLVEAPWSRDPLAQRLRWLDRAVSIAARSRDKTMKISLAASRVAVLACAGDPEYWQAIRDFPTPGDTAGEVEEAIRGYGNIADALLHIGHYQQAAEFNRRAIALSGERSSAFAVNFHLTGSQLDLLTGRWDGLERRLESRLTDVADWPHALHYCEAYLGLLLLARGDTRRALALLEPLPARLEGDSRMLTWVSAGIARARLAERQPAAAVAAVDPALRIVEEHGIWLCAGELVPVAVAAQLAAGRPAAAEKVTAALGAAVRDRDAPAAATALVRCRALLAEQDRRPDHAAMLYLQADHAWQGLSRPYEAARDRAAAGRCLVGTPAPERGHRLLLDALATYQELGAGWDAEQVRNLLRRSGLIPPHRRGRRSYGSQLSPRETEIAGLAEQGLSNREIARALHLSIKTVEGHLSSATRKLGASPRRGSDPATGR